MDTIKGLFPLLFVLAVPVLLIASNVRWAVNELQLYGYGFRTYQIAQVTGISEPDLERTAHTMRDYFNSSQEPLQVRVAIAGQQRELFTQREMLHMADVKGLVRGVYKVQGGVIVYLLLYTGLGILLAGRAFLPRLAKYLLYGCGLTVAVVALVGVASLVSFGPLFTLFHVISFSNDLWMLDPRQFYLTRLFPEGFWRDATLFVGLATVVEALLLAGASAAFLHRRSSRQTREPLRIA
ncbi:MAG: TIGR01906 family membrane protein [Dehalococcoidia bacterium]